MVRARQKACQVGEYTSLCKASMLSLGIHLELRESSRKWSSKVSVECSDAAEWKLGYESARYIEQLIQLCTQAKKSVKFHRKGRLSPIPFLACVETARRSSAKFSKVFRRPSWAPFTTHIGAITARLVLVLPTYTAVSCATNTPSDCSTYGRASNILFGANIKATQRISYNTLSSARLAHGTALVAQSHSVTFTSEHSLFPRKLSAALTGGALYLSIQFNIPMPSDMSYPTPAFRHVDLDGKAGRHVTIVSKGAGRTL